MMKLGLYMAHVVAENDVYFKNFLTIFVLIDSKDSLVAEEARFYEDIIYSNLEPEELTMLYYSMTISHGYYKYYFQSSSIFKELDVKCLLFNPIDLKVSIDGPPFAA